MAKNNPVRVQSRDLLLLVGLFESRIMTASHVAAIYFGGSKEAAKKRLQKLKAAGLVAERARRVNEPAVLFLTRAGFSMLSREGVLWAYPRLSPTTFEKRANVSALTIRHELEVMDVKAAFYFALTNCKNLSIAEFSTWPRLHEFKARRNSAEQNVLVNPDGFIRIHESERDGNRSEHTFFLEVDRSSETQATLAARIGCYLDYYKSGGFAEKNRATREQYKGYPFRVLIIVKSSARRENTAFRLLENNPTILTFAYLATYADAVANPLGDVWLRPVDFRDLKNPTPRALFDH